MDEIDPRKRAMIRVLIQERFLPLAVADIDAALAAADAADDEAGYIRSRSLSAAEKRRAARERKAHVKTFRLHPPK